MQHGGAEPLAAPFRQDPAQGQIDPRPVTFRPALDLAVANDTLINLGHEPAVLLAFRRRLGQRRAQSLKAGKAFEGGQRIHLVVCHAFRVHGIQGSGIFFTTNRAKTQACDGRGIREMNGDCYGYAFITARVFGRTGARDSHLVPVR
jgi:hypothetical protein